MDPQAVPFIKEIEKLLIRASRNDTCLIPGCSSQPIGSHVIARKTLELIADSSKVFTWDTKPSAWNAGQGASSDRGLPRFGARAAYHQYEGYHGARNRDAGTGAGCQASGGVRTGCDGHIAPLPPAGHFGHVAQASCGPGAAALSPGYHRPGGD